MPRWYLAEALHVPHGYKPRVVSTPDEASHVVRAARIPRGYLAEASRAIGQVPTLRKLASGSTARYTPASTHACFRTPRAYYSARCSHDTFTFQVVCTAVFQMGAYIFIGCLDILSFICVKALVGLV